MKNKILALIDEGNLSWMDIVDKMETVYGIKRVKSNKILTKLRKDRIIILSNRNLPNNTRI